VTATKTKAINVKGNQISSMKLIGPIRVSNPTFTDILKPTSLTWACRYTYR